MHHHTADDGTIQTTLAADGAHMAELPGITFATAALFAGMRRMEPADVSTYPERPAILSPQGGKAQGGGMAFAHEHGRFRPYCRRERRRGGSGRAQFETSARMDYSFKSACQCWRL